MECDATEDDKNSISWYHKYFYFRSLKKYQ